jgi:hypothetical protein
MNETFAADSIKHGTYLTTPKALMLIIFGLVNLKGSQQKCEHEQIVRKTSQQNYM